VNTNTIRVEHIIRLDGSDQGPAVIEVGPSGEIQTVCPEKRPLLRDAIELTAIPLLADSHAHLGISDGLTERMEFHTLERIDAQLRHLAVRGFGHVHSLGTDQRWLQQRLKSRLASGDANEKAFGYSAGIGFGAVEGWPPELTFPEPRFRPQEPGAARKQVRELAGLGCRTLKIWVDDFGGKTPKIPMNIVEAIVDEARNCGIITFAHVFFHADAEALVSLGIDVLAHSVRDKLMEPSLIESMSEKGVTLVPTLSREESEIAFSLEDNPYLHDRFFLSSEKDLINELRGMKFLDDPDLPMKRLDIAMQNIDRVQTAGVAIGLGTDSGFKMKIQGFAQHRELELLNKAGLTPANCLRAGLEINQRLFGTGMVAIEPGELASFFVVEGNPLTDIRATQRIREVWVCGKRLSGPDTLSRSVVTNLTESASRIVVATNRAPESHPRY
jgi:hypothetical protein